MRDAVIVGAVRTAVGRKNGKLSGVRADDLAALTLKELVDRVGIDLEVAGRRSGPAL